MAADERRLRGDGPVALRGVQVGVADTGAVELDETFTRGEVLWLLDWVIIFDGKVTEGFDDGGFLDLGDCIGHI